jgi:hypothetical protein
MAGGAEHNTNGSEGWSATVAALVLAISAFATTWCAYQASLWSGVRTDRALHAGTTSLAAQDAQAQGNQLYELDASMFGAYLDAKTSNRDRLASFVLDRFRPSMRAAVDAWLATEPFESAGSSSGPFKMPQYGVVEWSKAAALRKEASEHTQEALRANSVNDDYVFGTVLFAAVSLITGAASGLATRLMRRILLAFGVFALASCLVWALSRPVAHRESARWRDVVSDARLERRGHGLPGSTFRRAPRASAARSGGHRGIGKTSVS